MFQVILVLNIFRMSPFYLYLHLTLSFDIKGKRAYPFGPISFSHLAISFNYFKLTFIFSLPDFEKVSVHYEASKVVLVVKNLPANNPLRYFCLGNPMDRGA